MICMKVMQILFLNYLLLNEIILTLRKSIFENAKAQLFLAEENGKIVGRIAAVKDDQLIKFTGEAIGVFGF